jgi:hypothetical protein
MGDVRRHSIAVEDVEEDIVRERFDRHRERIQAFPKSAVALATTQGRETYLGLLDRKPPSDDDTSHSYSLRRRIVDGLSDVARSKLVSAESASIAVRDPDSDVLGKKRTRQ